MRILVLGGCGAMGSEATRDLSAYSDFSEIVVGDIDVPKAQAWCDKLGDKRLKAIAVNATDKASLVQEFGGYDVILNCTSYAFGLTITEAAIEARKPLLDLGGLYNTPKQLALTEQAEKAGVTIVLGMGATPGVTNLMAKAGSTHMDSVEEIHIAFATYRSIAPSPGLLSTVLDEFSPDTVRFYFESGEFVKVPPFSGEKVVRFDAPVGPVKTWFVPHSETHTLPRFIPGVRRVDVRGTWRPEIMTALDHYNQVGLLSTKEMDVAGHSIPPKEVLRSIFLANGGWPGEGEWAFLLNVEVVGKKADSKVTATYNLSHPPTDRWGQEATGKVTGIPASIGAQRLAKGEVLRQGVLGPEAAFEPWPFFADLAKREMFVREEVVSVRGTGQ
jgi:lysine 6-dehydrogenase